MADPDHDEPRIEKNKIYFSDTREEKKKEKKFSNCFVCGATIWHGLCGARWGTVCSRSCDLSRGFLGGGRSPTEVWELMRKYKLCEWETMEEWWRDMGHQYFQGAFLLRRNRGAKHSKANSYWATLTQALDLRSELNARKKESKVMPNGRTLGDCCIPYGIHVNLFLRYCSGISRRYGLTLNQVIEEFGMAPPPSPKWSEEITVQHQGQTYSIKRIASEAHMSTLSLYYRWMKGMFLIDDDIAYRISRERVRSDAKKRKRERDALFHKPFNEA